VSGSLPGLAHLQSKFAAHSARFQFLAIHDDSVESFTDLDPHLARLEKTLWKGQPLPFPILLDSSGATITTWGIDRFPTTVLIDPAGKLVGEVGENELEELFTREFR
jgi:hypothetical protein